MHAQTPFKKAFTFFFSLITLITCLLLLHFFWILPSDFANFNRLKSMKSQIVKSSISSEQESIGVQKDIWLAQDGKRLHHRINSQKSLITFIPKDNHYEVIERMEQLEGSMQEKIQNGVETVRQFCAKSGLYHYGNNEFFADTVTLDLVQRSKEEKKTVLSGTASSMMLQLRNHRPTIAANDLKAVMP